VRWVVRHRENGVPVYIHCAHGHGRSSVVLCAALIRAGLAPDPRSAMELAKRGRPRARLNERQRTALDAWFREEAGRTRAR